MNSRAVILERAAELLATSASGDVSTRAVCEAAGVGQPVLYRLFGDKDGLLAAVVDKVWREYLDMKRAARRSKDPLEDLRRGWDSHTAFALANPHAYRLLFGSALTTKPEAAAEAMGLLREVLERVAEHGRLRMSPDEASRIVMAANSGMALGLLLNREFYPDVSVSSVTREAVIRAITTDDGAPGADPGPAAAVTLRTQLAGSELFTVGEAGLFAEWLARIEQRGRPAR